MPTRQDALASVYARSLFQLAEQAGGQDKIEEVNDELEQILELTRRDPVFAEFLTSPIVDAKARADSLRRILDGRVTDLTLRFLLVLNNKGRLPKFESIAEAYSSLMQEAFGRIEVDVHTAGELGPEAVEAIRTRVRDALGREPVLHTYVDPSMIGGVRLRIGDRLIDGSVSRRLRRLRDELLEGSGWAIRERLEAIVQPGEPAA